MSARIEIARPILGSTEIAAVTRVLNSGSIAGGIEVSRFEDEFAAVVGDRLCVAVSSGTAALHLGLLALGIGAGDEVIVPSWTFVGTANAVALTGATPVFADIDANTYCIAPDAIRSAITARTAAIAPVHLYGHPAPMDAIAEIARHAGLAVVEDCAQAHLASFRGQPIGTFGDVAAFSFHATKNMTAGEGGMIVTADASIAARVRLLRNQGHDPEGTGHAVGFNQRLSDVHAAIARVQLGRLAGWNKTRRDHAAFLTRHLRGVEVPVTGANVAHAFHQFTVRVCDGDRDAFVRGLAEQGIDARVYYRQPAHRYPQFADRVLPAALPETDRAAREVLSLPVHPSLTDANLVTIVEAVNLVAGGRE